MQKKRKTIPPFLMPKQSDKDGLTYDFGCLMLQIKAVQIPHFAAMLAAIDTADLYESDKPGEFGLEFEPHVTMLYGFHDAGEKSLPGKILNEPFLPTDAITLKLTGISNFHNPQYDVVKFDVNSPGLVKLNKAYTKRYEHTNTYDYNPHLTIAYVKSGKGPEYGKKLWELVGGKPIRLNGTKLAYSRPSGEKIITPLT